MDEAYGKHRGVQKDHEPQLSWLRVKRKPQQRTQFLFMFSFTNRVFGYPLVPNISLFVAVYGINDHK